MGLPLPTSKLPESVTLWLSGLPWGYLRQRANPWISLHGGWRGYLGAIFAKQQIVGLHWAALELLFPTCKSLNFIALGLPGLPWATFTNDQIIGCHCSCAIQAALGLPLPANKSIEFHSLGLLGQPWATFPNEQIIGFHCSAAIGATSGLPLPTSKSLNYIAQGACGFPGGYLFQPANH